MRRPEAYALPDVVLDPGILTVPQFTSPNCPGSTRQPVSSTSVKASRAQSAGVPGARLRSAASEHDSCDQKSLTQALACIIKHNGCMVQFFSVRWHIENERLKALLDVF